MSNTKLNQCTITLTRNCNLRCGFCYAKETEYLRDDSIESENLKRIIDFCDEAEVKYIVFTGGEPTLYPELIETLKYIKSKQNKMIPTIATNGIMLQNIDFCKNLIENGIEYIDISMKGSSQKSCIDTVGCDCFYQQQKAISNLSALPVEFTCSMVLTWNNIDTFCDAVKAAYQSGGRQFSFTFIIDNELSEYKDIEYLEKHDPFDLINSFISKIDTLNSITDDWWIEYSFPFCMYTNEQLSLLTGRLALPCQIYKGNSITFDTHMNLLPCNMFIGNEMGEFLKDFSSYNEFCKYSESGVYRETMNKLAQMPSSYCTSCKHYESCYGGCPVTWKNYSFEALNKFRIQQGYGNIIV